MLPKHMSDACFSVAETAEIISIPEQRLRDWIARTPINPLGEKPKGRIWFSGWEVFVWRIVRDLASAGYTPHSAVMTAFRTAGGPMKRAPRENEFALVGGADDAAFIDRRGSWSDLGGQAGIVIPLSLHWAEISQKCEAMYAA